MEFSVQAVVLYTFEGRVDAELTVEEGESVSILKEEGDWYLVLNSKGERGLAPKSHLELEENSILGLIERDQEEKTKSMSKRFKISFSLETRYPVDHICLSPTFLAIGIVHEISFIRRDSDLRKMKRTNVGFFMRDVQKIEFLRDHDNHEIFLVVLKSSLFNVLTEIRVLKVPKKVEESQSNENIISHERLGSISPIYHGGVKTHPLCKIGTTGFLSFAARGLAFCDHAYMLASDLEVKPHEERVGICEVNLKYCFSIGYHERKHSALVLMKRPSFQLLFYDIGDKFPLQKNDISVVDQNKEFSGPTHVMDLASHCRTNETVSDGMIHVFQKKGVAVVLFAYLSSPGGNLLVLDLDSSEVIRTVERNHLFQSIFFPLGDDFILLKEKHTNTEKEEKDVVVVYDFMKNEDVDVLGSSFLRPVAPKQVSKEDYDGSGGCFCIYNLYRSGGRVTVRVDVMEKVRNFDDLLLERVGFVRGTTFEDYDVFSVCVSVVDIFSVRIPRFIILL